MILGIDALTFCERCVVWLGENARRGIYAVGKHVQQAGSCHAIEFIFFWELHFSLSIENIYEKWTVSQNIEIVVSPTPTGESVPTI